MTTPDGVRLRLMQAWRDRQAADDKLADVIEDAREIGLTWDELAEPLHSYGVTGRSLWADAGHLADGPEIPDDWKDAPPRRHRRRP